MLAVRLMPCLLMSSGALVKTTRFKDPIYVGDPVNAVRIFNQKEVDELVILDICSTSQSYGIDYDTLGKVVGECFMPICYGGGVNTIQEMRKLFSLGIEKISLGSAAFLRPGLIKDAVAEFGSQAIVVTLDVKKSLFGSYSVYINRGIKDMKIDPINAAKRFAELGVGEILLNSIDREGTWSGFDLKLIKQVTSAVDLPVIAMGGAGNLQDVRLAVTDGGASAVAIGSMAVFQGKDLGVLIKFPSRENQDTAFI